MLKKLTLPISCSKMGHVYPKTLFFKQFSEKSNFSDKPIKFRERANALLFFCLDTLDAICYSNMQMRMHASRNAKCFAREFDQFNVEIVRQRCISVIVWFKICIQLQRLT